MESTWSPTEFRCRSPTTDSSRPIFGLTVLALAVAWMAGCGMRIGSATPAFLTRQDLADDIIRILDEFGIEPDSASAGRRLARPVFSDVDPARQAALERLDRSGLLRGFSDRSFRPEAAVRWGEALHAWSRLVRLLRERADLAARPEPAAWSHVPWLDDAASCLPLPPAWAWLRHDLDPLVSMGVVDAALLRSIRLERMVDRVRWHKVTLRTIQAVRPASAGTEISALPPSNDEPEQIAAKDQTSLVIEVRDSIRRRPIEGVQVIANGKTLSPGPDGLVRLRGHPVGAPVDLLFTAPGHVSLRLQHIAGTKATRSILLKPIRATLTLQIRSAADRRPLSRARVTIKDRTVASDDRGQAVFRGLAAGYHTVEIDAAGFHRARQLVFLEESDSTRALRLQPQIGW